jgi:hypothetical protein
MYLRTCFSERCRVCSMTKRSEGRRPRRPRSPARIAGSGRKRRPGRDRPAGEHFDRLRQLVVADGFAAGGGRIPPADRREQILFSDVRAVEPGAERPDGAGLRVGAIGNADGLPFPLPDPFSTAGSSRPTLRRRSAGPRSAAGPARSGGVRRRSRRAAQRAVAGAAEVLRAVREQVPQQRRRERLLSGSFLSPGGFWHDGADEFLRRRVRVARQLVRLGGIAVRRRSTVLAFRRPAPYAT